MEPDTSNNYQKPLPLRYLLKIFDPDSPKTLAAIFESTNPFATISKGDIIYPHMWPSAPAPRYTYRVVAIEHHIAVLVDHITHELQIHCELVEGNWPPRKPNAGS